MIDTLVDLVDQGTISVVGGHIKFYTGTRPASPDNAPTGTFLAQKQLVNPAFQDASGGSSTANAIGSFATWATGTVTWFRIVDRDDNAIMDGTCGITGSGADIEFNTVDWTFPGTVEITSLRIYHP